MIYFIRHTEYVKIGYTNNVLKRFSDLQVSCPVKLDMIGLIEGDLSDESRYHLMFDKSYSHGEWFKYDKEMESFVSGLDRSLLWKYGFIKNEENSFDVIRSLKKKLKITNKEFSEKLGITVRGLNDLESRCMKGKVPLGNISRVLGNFGYDIEIRVIKKMS